MSEVLEPGVPATDPNADFLRASEADGDYMKAVLDDRFKEKGGDF